MTKVAINGFGRIGRAFVRRAQGRDIDIVAINDLGSPENLAYLLRHDTVYGKFPSEVSTREGSLVIGDHEVKMFSEKDPANLPWGELDIDVVVEATGAFTDPEKAQAHLKTGAKHVVITAPIKSEKDAATVLMGLNQEKIAANPITSNASCTTNAAAPVIAILDETLGIEKAILSTTHAYTASQSLVDGASSAIGGKDAREGRAAAQNIVPTATGAATAVTSAYESLAGKFDGISLRVPVVAGSIADITFIAKRPTTREEVNDILRRAATDSRWNGIFKTTDEELVSSDIVGEPYGSIADLSMTRVVDGTLVKVLAWYDNEMGYAETLVRHVLLAGRAAP